jgi:hypothetical protein
LPKTATAESSDPAEIPSRAGVRSRLPWPRWAERLPLGIFRMRLVRGESVDPETRSEMARVRAGNMELVNPANAGEDRVSFESAIDDSTAVLLRDRQGALAGYYLLYSYEVEIRAARQIVWHMRYLHLSKACRGHAGLYLSSIVFFVVQHLRCPTIPKYVMGPALPNSYVFVERMTKTWSLRQPDTPPVERALLAKLGSVVGKDFDPLQGTLASTSAPRSTGTKRSAASAQALARYETLHPRWREGRALLVISRITAVGVLRSFTIGLRRLLGARPRRA